MNIKPGVARGYPVAGEEMSLAHYLLVLWRYRLVILIATLCGTGLGLVLSWMSPSVYEASARLLVTPPGGEEKLANAASYAAVINNQSLARDTLKELGVAWDPHSVSVTTVPEANILVVHARLHQAALAARLANGFSQRAVRLVRAIREKDSVDSRESLRVQMEGAERHLAQMERRLETLRRDAHVESLQADVDGWLEQRRELRALRLEIDAERARVKKASDELAREEPSRAFPRSLMLRTPQAATTHQPPDVGRGGEAPEGSAELRDGLFSPYANPVYELLAQQLASARTRLASLEARLAGQVADAGDEKRIEALNKAQAAIDRLATEHEVATQVYLTASTRYHEARLRAAAISTTLQVIDEAVVPDDPVSPRTVRNTVAGTALAGGAAMVFVLLFHAITAEGRKTPAVTTA